MVSNAPAQLRAQLSAGFNGQVIAPDDAGYDDARTIFPGGFDYQPALVVRPSDAAAVAQVVSLARDTGTELAVRSGGHSVAGHGTTEGGIVLDLANLRETDVDPNNRTAWVGTGLSARDLSIALGEHGLATGLGDSSPVGIGGLTLGGGVGYLSRKHGMTVDHLLGAELVTADGSILTVDAGNHPDLFWAIRGGGGNFGVATKLHFRVHHLPSVTGGMLVLPATPQTLQAVIAEAQQAPEELTTIVTVGTAPPTPAIPEEWHGKLVITTLMCFAGPPGDGETAIAPFRAMTTPIVDTVRPIAFPEIYPPPRSGIHPTAVSRTLFLNDIGGNDAETITNHLRDSDAAARGVQLRVLGGAVARVPDDATAYAFRSMNIIATITSSYAGPDDKGSRAAWVDELAAAIGQRNSGAYVNFIGDEEPDRVRDAYPGATWDRLTAIKAEYDPANVFRRNHNIPPSASP